MPPRSRGRPAREDPATQALSEAEALRQRGERRKGLEAVQCLQQAADLYQSALSLGLGGDDASEARFGLAWSLQLCGDAMREATSALPDEKGSWQAEREARDAAVGMYRSAVVAYRQVSSEAGRMRDDAAANCGNTLCSLAEALVEDSMANSTAAASDAASCYREARACYDAAIQSDPDEASGWSNLADCLLAYAQLLAESLAPQAPTPGDVRAQAEAVCSEGLAAYERACALCDSSQGDDLPGLLCNWGSGLLAAAQMQQDASTCRSLLDQAVRRLQHSASFALADPEPLIKLGDALAAAAAELMPGQRLQQQQQQQQQQAGIRGVVAQLGVPFGPQESSGAGSGVGAGGEAGAAHAAAELLRRALQEGYGVALDINRSNAEALVGSAEVHASLAKLAVSLGDAAAADTHWSSSVRAYESALRNPKQLGPFSERCSVRFNLACTLAQWGKEEQTHSVLVALLECGGVTAADLATDPDLAGVQDRPWFQQLLAAAAVAANQ